MAANNEVSTSSIAKMATNAISTLLQDPIREEQETSSDRVAASVTTNAGNVVQASVAPTMPFNPDFKMGDDYLSMSYSADTGATNPTKLVDLRHANWLTSHNRTHEVFRCTLPEAFWSNNAYPAYGQSRYFAAVRCGFHIQVQLNVNMGTAGCLLVVYLPKTAVVNFNTYTFSTFTNFPHVLMNAATTSQADLYIPYVNNRNFAKTDSDDLGAVFGFVWSALTVPSGSPTTLDVTVFGSLLDLDFQCPRPFGADVSIYNQAPRKRKTKATRFKWTRNCVDIAEGPGSMNMANVLHTTGSQTIALVGERAFYDPRTAGTTTRIKDLKMISQLYSVLRGDAATTASNSGYFVWSSNTTPENFIYEYGVWMEDLPNLDMMASCFAFWRGSIVLKLTVYASTFNKGRLRMAAFPNVQSNVAGPSCKNAVYMVCDLGLNNTFELTVPYTWANWMRPTRGKAICWVRIDVMNRLTYNSSSPNAVNCILQVRAGDDAEFFIPAGSPLTWQGMRSWGSEMDLVDSLDNPEEIVDNVEANIESAQGQVPAVETGLRSTENDGTLTQQLNISQPKFLNFKIQDISMYAVSHTLVDHFFGRSWHVSDFNYDNGNLREILVPFPTSQHGAMARMFAYFVGEVNFHITNVGNSCMLVSHTYFGQTEGVNRLTQITSNGVLSVPPNSQMTVNVPYYSEVPLRNVKQDNYKTSGLGSIFFQATGAASSSGRVTVYASIRCPNFFFPVAAPRHPTTRQVLTSPVGCHDHLTVTSSLGSLSLDDEVEVHQFCDSELANCLENARKFFNLRRGSSAEDLLKCGDIESNPGPTMELVYKDRGFYKHYGVRVGDYIYHLDSQDILTTALSGEAIFDRVRDDGNWIISQVADLDYFTDKYMNSLLGSKHIFSATQNCETIALDIFGSDHISQSKALGIVGVILLSAGLLSLMAVPWDISSLKLVYNQSLEGDAEGLTLLSQRCMTFFSNAMAETFNNDLVKFIIKILIRLLCYIVLYCHAPNLLTTMCLGTLLVMDITTCEVLSASTKALFQSLMDGDVKSLVSKIAESMTFARSSQEQAEEMGATFTYANEMVDFCRRPMNNESFQDFNTVSMSFRHIEWWLSTFKNIYGILKGIFSPSLEQKAIKWMSRREEQIADILNEASCVIVQMKDPKNQRDSAAIQRYFAILERMKVLVAICVKVAPSTRFSNQIFRMFSELIKINIRVPTNTDLTRMEPVGIWISSEPGQGKSFLTHMLTTRLAKECGLSGIYTNPTGSEFMDGYIGQDIHIIDDAGQNREEKDLALLCQCISSVPFTVPMADLAEKGTFYTSKLVVATTNKMDFTSMVLTDSEALARRFPFNFRVRAKVAYCKNNKLNVPDAMAAMADGSCWEISKDSGRNWVSLSMDDLVQEISTLFKQREQALLVWQRKLAQVRNEGPGFDFTQVEETLGSLERRFGQISSYIQSEVSRCTEELIDQMEDFLTDTDTPFQCFEMKKKLSYACAPQNVKEWVKKHTQRLADFVSENKGWFFFFSILSTFLSVLTLVYFHYSKKKKEEVQERAYNPQTIAKKGGRSKLQKVDFPIVFKNEAPYIQELEHCFAQACYLSASNTTEVVHCAAVHSNVVACYGHAENFLDRAEDLILHFKGASFAVDAGKISKVTLDGGAMDLILIVIDKFPIVFKNYTKHYTQEIGSESLLVWNSPQGRLAMPVSNVHAAGPLVTLEGTQTKKTYAYNVSSKRGMCGGLLVTRVAGSFKILGMHIAGNGSIARAAAMYFLSQFKNEGVVLSKTFVGNPVFQPSRTALHPSPIAGHFSLEMEPAVLSPKDRRLEVNLESVVKTAAAKYRVNVFKPDEKLWTFVLDEVKSDFRRVLGIHKRVSVQQAVLGYSDLSSLDLSTSPGTKYVRQGFTKKQLLCLDPFFIHPVLLEDVKKLLASIYALEKPATIFTAFLKDELRKVGKVKEGKTRCIEACSIDYVIAYRVVMSSLYESIYQTKPEVLGMAVGMNPWVDWDAMMNSLYSYNYGLDYSSYDGSLSEELMRSAVEVLAYCHEEPEQVMVLHETVLNSVHLVMDEIWEVKGGMPSGSPCTTVLNSICNILVCKYLAYEQSATVKVLPIVYGDDVIFSVSEEIQPADLVLRAKEVFGMEMTSSDKTPVPILLDVGNIEFLKRTTRYFPGTTFKVGALNLSTMEQHIMWMKNLDTFPQQLASFENELALHGERVYNSYKEVFNKILEPWKMFMDDYDLVIRRMLYFVFE